MSAEPASTETRPAGADSVLRIEFRPAPSPEQYRRIAGGVWALLLCAGHEHTATVVPDGTTTRDDLAGTFERLIQTCPWGW